jgi:Na+/H+ antiporter NhaD/arsenite permease-like protein/CBS domain-containing protein
MAQQTMLETNVGSLKDMVPSKQKAKPTDPVSTVLSNYATASPGDSVATAVLAMNTAKRASILVMNEDRSMAGIFTERDFVTRVLVNNKDPNDIKLSDVMTPAKDLLIASTRSSIGDCRQKMLSNNIRHLPIVDDENKVTGVVSMSEIIKVLQYETLRLESANLATDGSVDATMRQREIANQIALSTGEEGSKQDLARTGYVAAAGAVGVALLQAGWVHDNEYISMTAVFLLGYAGIIFEDIFEFNKAAVALLMSTALWTIYASEPGSAGVLVDGAGSMLGEKLAEVSEIAFFLMGAMTIVEVVDAHQGFKVVTDKINSKDLRGLMWVIGLLTFFMSAILDNLTTTIVMVSLLKKILPEGEDRKLFGAMIVIAANAGGAWTPIGDVTTTMLWINGQISALPTMTSLVIPSLISTLIPIALLSQQLPEGKEVPENTSADVDLAPRGSLVFAAGIGGLLAVPAFKALTGLPPYLGMLASLGTLWGITDAIHAGEDRDEFMAPAALKKIDTSGVLFFTGILMSVAALDSAGILKSLAETMDKAISSEYVLATVIGIASALIDNVPLVAATMGMYDINTVTPDSQLWQLIAYCAGTGGSLLVIGSAAGVALMGQEKVDFFWYAKKVTVAAFAGYMAGVGAYAVQNGAVGGIMNGVAQMPLVHDALTALPVF